MCEFTLAPVAFDPDVTAVSRDPMAPDPNCVGAGWLNVISGGPHIVAAVPAVIAGVPGPVGVCRRRRRNAFDSVRRRWADADDDLGVCDTCSEKEAAGGGEEDFLHRAISYMVLMVERAFGAQVVVRVPNSYLGVRASERDFREGRS